MFTGQHNHAHSALAECAPSMQRSSTSAIFFRLTGSLSSCCLIIFPHQKCMSETLAGPPERVSSRGSAIRKTQLLLKIGLCDHSWSPSSVGTRYQTDNGSYSETESTDIKISFFRKSLYNSQPIILLYSMISAVSKPASSVNWPYWSSRE